MYSDLTDWTGGEIEFFSPKAGGLADYVAIKFDDGQRVTISNSCAANVLGLISHNISHMEISRQQEKQ